MKLLDRLRECARVKHRAYRTEQNYAYWVVRFLRFFHGPDGWRHPETMGASEVEQFLTHLAGGAFGPAQSPDSGGDGALHVME